MLVAANVEAGDAGGIDRLGCNRPRGQQHARVFKRYAVIGYVETEGYIGPGVVHVVALNAFIHDAESAAHHGLAGSRDVVGKSDARAERQPVVVDKALRHVILFGDANAIEVERNAGQNRIRA